MKKILVIGDYIEDNYVWGASSRICPEAPVPVILPDRIESRPGGAGLVAAQLHALGADVKSIYGSLSIKERIYAGNHMVCRIDRDSLNRRSEFSEEVIQEARSADIVVVSDYGKGSFTQDLARRLVFRFHPEKPLFVDAKNNFDWYQGFAAFPNEKETLDTKFYENVIRKMGSRGCCVGDYHVKVNADDLCADVCGAGDVFLAAFVHRFTSGAQLEDCARFANLVAGISVRHPGSYVVSADEIKAETFARGLDVGESWTGTQATIH